MVILYGVWCFYIGYISNIKNGVFLSIWVGSISTCLHNIYGHLNCGLYVIHVLYKPIIITIRRSSSRHFNLAELPTIFPNARVSDGIIHKICDLLICNLRNLHNLHNYM